MKKKMVKLEKLGFKKETILTLQAERVTGGNSIACITRELVDDTCRFGCSLACGTNPSVCSPCQTGNCATVAPPCGSVSGG